MRLCARKARNLDIGEFIVFGIISGPSLDVVAGVGAAVEKRRHDLAVLISQCAIVSNGIGLRCLFHARPTVSRQRIAFDYNSPAELHLSRRRGRHADYRRFATAAEAIHYAVVELRTRRSLSAWMQVSGSTRTKSTDCMTMMITRCANRSDGNLNGALLSWETQDFKGAPRLPQNRVNPRALAMTSAGVMKRWETLGCQMGRASQETRCSVEAVFFSFGGSTSPVPPQTSQRRRPVPPQVLQSPKVIPAMDFLPVPRQSPQ
jgi:hypothetical protein